MKIAFCIIAHKYSPVLETLVSQIGKGRGKVYLHVDAKSDMQHFAPILDRVLLVEKRIDVGWGRFSLVECMLALLNETKKSEYDLISFISGDTLPLRPWSEIEDYFERHKGEEFVDIKPVPQQYIRRIKYNHPSDDVRKRSFLTRIFRGLQYRLSILPRNKFFADLPTLYFGSQWISITPHFRDFVFEYLGQHPSYMKAFEQAYCGDELFFQMILADSPYYKNNNNVCLFFLDWKSGPTYPKIFSSNDIQSIARHMKPHHMFARKIEDEMDLNTWSRYFRLQQSKQ